MTSPKGTSISLPNSPPIFLAPFSAEEFESTYLEKSVLAIHRQNNNHFRDVINITEIDELVTSLRIPVTNLNLAQDNIPLPAESYCIGTSYVDKARVMEFHRKGATIILRSVEQWSPNLNRLRIMAEEFFGCDCQINAYVTPPNQKSTPPHWDTHDLFVMQIAGNKVWRLYESKRTFPLSDERFNIDEDDVSQDFKEITLYSGDSLYLPRGIIHEPVAQTYSVHLSIGIHTIRWFDIVSVGLRLLAQREGSAFRSSVSKASKLAHLQRLEEEIALLAAPELQMKALDILRKKFVGTRAEDLQGAMLNFAQNLGGYADSLSK